MKTINREISDISGIDLAISEQKLLKGGNPAYIYCRCYELGGSVPINEGWCGLGSWYECDMALLQLYPDLNCECEDNQNH